MSQKRKTLEDFIVSKIQASGFPLELYVASLLAKASPKSMSKLDPKRYQARRGHVWSVQSNPYFLDRDDMTGKELDIKAYLATRSESPLQIGIQLLIECKKIPGNAWVFYQSPSLASSVRIPTRYMSWFEPVMSMQEVDKGSYYPLLLDGYLNSCIESLHFSKCVNRATSYQEIIFNDKESNKRDSNIFESVVSLIKATSFEFQSEMETWKNFYHEHVHWEAYVKGPWNFFSLYYPVIVREGPIYTAKLDGDIGLTRQKYVQLYLDYKSGAYSGRFLIDIVEKDFFQEYLAWINSDVLTLYKHVAGDWRTLRQSLGKAARRNWNYFKKKEPQALVR